MSAKPTDDRNAQHWPHRHLGAQGYIARDGQIVDATIVAVPRQRNTREENEAIKVGLLVAHARASKFLAATAQVGPDFIGTCCARATLKVDFPYTCRWRRQPPVAGLIFTPDHDEHRINSLANALEC